MSTTFTLPRRLGHPAETQNAKIHNFSLISNTQVFKCTGYINRLFSTIGSGWKGIGRQCSNVYMYTIIVRLSDTRINK